MLTKRYMPGVKNLPAILDKVVSGTAPAKFTTAHMKNIGFPWRCAAQLMREP